MRADLGVAAVLAALALAGCSSSEPNSPVDPEKAEASDYVVPSIIFGVSAIALLVFLGVVLIVRRRRDQTDRSGAARPPEGKARGP